MPHRLPKATRLISGFAIASAGVLAIVVVSFVQVRSSLEASRWVTHTHEVISQLDTIDRMLVTPGNDANLTAAINRLSHLVRDNALQSQRAAQLRQLIRAGRPAESVISDMRRNEQRLLAERAQRSEDQARLTEITLTVGTVADMAMLAVIFTLIRRDLVRRAALSKALIRARDEAIRSADVRSQFLANMSHEIRTPLNAVIGFTGLLLDKDLDPAERELAVQVRDSGSALLTIVNEILDFSKIEAGKVGVELVDFDLRETVDAVVQLFAEAAAAKGLEIGLLWDQIVPDVVRGDASRIRQVLTNLIGNAVKFTSNGDVIVSVNQESDAEFIRISVTDTGVGISDDEESRLFQPFTQADLSTTRKYGGTGLGLAISKNLVELMGGTIGFDSQKGKGSTFWFRLPFARASEELPVRFESEGLAGRRALIVDDAETSRRIVRANLSAWRMPSEEASGAAEALEKLRAGSFDVVLIDLVMPDTDGIVLSRLIKSDPAIASVPIILMTPVSNPVERSVMDAIGIACALTKPPRQSALHDAITNAISGSFTAADETAPRPAKRAMRTDVRILIAEDNSVNRKLAVLQLETLGLRADTVANGVEVLEALNRINYDLVLMDCQMPEMDGFDATREIRRRESDRHRIPVIALTANTMTADRDRCAAAGMDDYLTKPIDLKELQRVLDRFLPEPGDALDAAVIADLQRLAAGDEGLLAEIVSLYVDDAKMRIAAMEEALSTGDPAKLADAAHALRSGAGNIGASRVRILAKQLEEIGRAHTLDGAAALLDDLRRENALATDRLDAVAVGR